ncbi:P-loop containing nucleoside triphosphate hydrolases superfamily protein isoform X2 [Tasmannia lanceolata]|uniref:P-loop containing nucleoside triphosphate hydrolases superfamily protein isoform X2 n=1 Tax=Tasmannia lanceolata TaxID=3420 RepID=UPI004063EC19
MGVEKGGIQIASSQLSRFQKIVLTWDYLRLLKESSSQKKKVISEGFAKVKDTFKDVSEYIGIFEPLLFEEVKALIVHGRDEEEMEWQRGGVKSCLQEPYGFHMVSLGVQYGFGKEVSENDLLLLSKDNIQEEAPLPTAYAFALVEYREFNRDLEQVTLRLRTFLAGEVKQMNTDEIESSPRLLRMLSILTANQSVLSILKIGSLSTIMREYVALQSISTLPFKDLILSATEKSADDTSVHQAWNVPRPLMEFLTSNHNPSQLAAIHAGLSRKTFVLIQGPPGTGKTQTILGLLSAILHAVPARVQSKGGLFALTRRPELPIQDKYCHWGTASPWLNGTNPRDLIMPIDGDDGFFPTTGNELKPEVVNSNRKYRVHVLVCAPSNSALDEIVLRLLNTGLRDENEHVYNPKIVRIGLKPHHSVQAVSMDYLVEQKLASMDRSTAVAGKPASAIGAMDRDRIRASILDEAAIVFSTLSFSGSTVFTRMNRVFDVVIIDEAAQAVEPATLVPLAHGCKQVFLVGDPVQLPATVISSIAERFGYGKSLFKRFQMAGYPVQMLKTQYRMHSKIRMFPSKEFYSNSLDDGPNIDELTKRKWHEYRCFGPFCFFDIDGVESQPSGSGSWVNVEEVEFIFLMYCKLVTEYPELKSSYQLAIITPYRHQVKLFRERFRDAFGTQSDKFVDINTVDGFQGREKEVAIFSCVRANSGGGIGFVADFRRMNVGITRARSSILVVGSASTLMQDKHWSNLVRSASDENCFFKVSKPYSLFFAGDNLGSMKLKRDDPNPKEVKPNPEIGINNVIGDDNPLAEGYQEGHMDDDAMDVDDGGFDED